MKIESPVLKRLGPVPFWRGEKKCLTEFNRIYKKAREYAVAKIFENTPLTNGRVF